MTEANINRLVSKLSQMRGAALKLGQFMSIQGVDVLTSGDGAVLTNLNQTRMHFHQNWTRYSDGYRIVRIICRTGRWRSLCFHANHPGPLTGNLQQVMTSALGPSWAENFTSFDRVPFAAASIGQVHNAALRASASPTGMEERVAVKIQFPNIANSIASDVGYVKLLLTAGHLLPKGLFLDRTVQVSLHVDIAITA